MPRGPLPDPNARRRNAPTIPTTKLPAGGRKGRAPNPPDWVELGTAGTAWWKWAWRTPQAAAWSKGDLVMIARRASLEDDMSLINDADTFDVLDALGDEDGAALKFMIGRLVAMASGRLAIAKEMLQLDDRLGLTPKGMASLRWTIVADAPSKASASKPSGVSNLDDRRSRLTSAS